MQESDRYCLVDGSLRLPHLCFKPGLSSPSFSQANSPAAPPPPSPICIALPPRSPLPFISPQPCGGATLGCSRAACRLNTALVALLFVRVFVVVAFFAFGPLPPPLFLHRCTRGSAVWPPLQRGPVRSPRPGGPVFRCTHTHTCKPQPLLGPSLPLFVAFFFLLRSSKPRRRSPPPLAALV